MKKTLKTKVALNLSEVDELTMLVWQEKDNLDLLIKSRPDNEFLKGRRRIMDALSKKFSSLEYELVGIEEDEK